MAKQPPLLLRTDRSDPPRRHLYSFPDNTHYTSPLPPEFHHISDYSHGYLIAALLRHLCCFNPSTGDRFSVPFPEDWTIDKVYTAVFTDSPASGRCNIVVFTSSHMLYCRFRVGDRNPPWEIISFSDLFDVNTEDCVLQAVMFKGLLYCLCFSKVFAIELQGATPKVIFRPELSITNCLGSISANCLLVDDDELLVVHLVHNPHIHDDMNKVYRLQDPEVGNWQLVGDVGGRTLFVTHLNGFIPVFEDLLASNMAGMIVYFLQIPSAVYLLTV